MHTAQSTQPETSADFLFSKKVATLSSQSCLIPHLGLRRKSRNVAISLPLSSPFAYHSSPVRLVDGSSAWEDCEGRLLTGMHALEPLYRPICSCLVLGRDVMLRPIEHRSGTVLLGVP